MSANLNILLKNEIERDICGLDVKFIKDDDSDSAETLNFDNGKIEKEDLIPGSYKIELSENTKKDKDASYNENSEEESKNIYAIYGKFENRNFQLDIEKINILHIQGNKGNISD